MPLVKGGWQILRGPRGLKSPAPPQPASRASAGQQKGGRGGLGRGGLPVESGTVWVWAWVQELALCVRF